MQMAAQMYLQLIALQYNAINASARTTFHVQHHINLLKGGVLTTKKSPRGIRPRHCCPSPWSVKYVMVTQDTSPSPCSERHNKYFFGRAKTGGLGQVTTQKNNGKNERKQTSITRPRPDVGGYKQQ